MNFDGRIEAQIVIPSGVTVSATNSGGGPTAVTIAAGSYYPSTLVAQVKTALQAQRAPSTGSWNVTLSTGITGTGCVSISCTGTWSIAWTSTNLRDVLGFTVDFTSVTGTHTSPKQAKALWLPDSPLQLDGDPGRAPIVTDARATIAPTGGVYGVVGNAFYRHKNLLWPSVPRAKVWESQAALGNASWEQFVKDTQLAQGTVSWFGPYSLVQVYDHNAIQLGIDANGGAGLAGWTMPDVVGVEPKKRDNAQWVGLWEIPLSQLVSAG